MEEYRLTVNELTDVMNNYLKEVNVHNEVDKQIALEYYLKANYSHKKV